MKKCIFAEYRNWAMANYLLGTGQRLNTLINVKIGDINLSQSTIKLSVTKGRRETELPLSNTVCKVLKEYLRHRGGSPNDYLFCTINGEKTSPETAKSAIKNHNRKNNVSRTSVHLFRHAFAKMYLMNGGDVFRLQKLLCHRNITTTKEYRNFTSEDLKVDFDKLNPLDSMTKEVIKMR